MRNIRVIRSDAMKKLLEDQINNSSVDTVLDEIRSQLIVCGQKSFTTLIR